jgi:hypothetical protein
MTIGSLLAVQANRPATVPGLTMCIKTCSFGTAFFGQYRPVLTTGINNFKIS